jgi:hypothetical protein
MKKKQKTKQNKRANNRPCALLFSSLLFVQFFSFSVSLAHSRVCTVLYDTFEVFARVRTMNFEYKQANEQLEISIAIIDMTNERTDK